jgi:hypothetical protein
LLGFEVEEILFTDESVARVHGLRLTDGRRVVVKLHPPGVTAPFLRAVQAAQRHLAAQGFPAPVPVAGPTESPDGLATAETLLDEGEVPDAHDPEVRAAMAAGLARQVGLCRTLMGAGALAGNAMRVSRDRLWPGGLEERGDWIDAAARRARRVRDRPAGAVVIGHTDWRAQNLRIAGTRLTAAYDWESLDFVAEPVLVGGCAHGFTVDWNGEPRFPTLAQALGFIGDYERARGAPFSPAEHATARASLVYSTAFTARSLEVPLASQLLAEAEEVM